MVILYMHSWAVTQFGNTAALKSLPGALKLLPGAWNVTSFSLYTDSSHNYEIYNIFMSEQIDLHIFKVITAASCVDIIISKRLNKYN